MSSMMLTSVSLLNTFLPMRIRFVPERFRQARKRADLSMEGAAKEMGIGKLTVYRYEKGITSPSGEALLQMAVLYGVDPRQFAEIDQAETKPEAVAA